MSDYMNVVLVADTAAGMRVLQVLAQSGVRIAAVMARQPTPGPTAGVWELSRRLGFQTWPVEQVKDPDLGERIRHCRVDILLNVHSLFRIHKDVLEAPRLGSFNLHPGPLPRYAGLNSVSWAIYRGEREHGVTLHRMQATIDAGPIVYQEIISIACDDKGLSLTTKCVNAGIPLILRLIETASRRPADIPSIPQDLSNREYFGHEIPQNGNLSWDRPARQVIDFIRACDYLPFRSSWGLPRTRLGTSILGVAKAMPTGRPADRPPGTVGGASDGAVEVACVDEWLLVRHLQLGGTIIPAIEVLKKGDRLTDCATMPVGDR
jgi:methionyl-tRNA formyltransferase